MVRQNWKKGMRLKRGDLEGTILDNGRLVSEGKWAFEEYEVRWDNGFRQRLFPLSQDLVSEPSGRILNSQKGIRI